MPFDPTLPATNSPNSSAEMRAQFNALNDLINSSLQGPPGPQGDPGPPGPPGEVTSGALEGAINGCARDPDPIVPLNLTVSHPPTQSEVQQIADQTRRLDPRAAPPSARVARWEVGTRGFGTSGLPFKRSLVVAKGRKEI